jgi:pantetheine-phosphate adenylyltransferase
VANNPEKTALFTYEERMQLIREAVNGDRRVEVDSFDGLLVDYANKRSIHTVLRGLRAVSDFEYEFQLANMNRKLDPEFDSVFVMTGEDYYFVSARLVREVARFGGDVSALVPANVLAGLHRKLGGARKK